ncbi:hypothetical protein EON81_01945 [bacterium]|nr:MAG: hypothetical protein EON81_01945 [bacterium]
MTQKKPSPKPVWWKNTYFWIAAILLIVGVAGLPFLGNDAAIRDPGQKRESNLWLMYIVAGGLMFANGWLSHRQTVRAYEEENAA